MRRMKTECGLDNSSEYNEAIRSYQRVALPKSADVSGVNYFLQQYEEVCMEMIKQCLITPGDPQPNFRETKKNILKAILRATTSSGGYSNSTSTLNLSPAMILGFTSSPFLNVCTNGCRPDVVLAFLLIWMTAMQATPPRTQHAPAPRCS